MGDGVHADEDLDGHGFTARSVVGEGPTTAPSLLSASVSSQGKRGCGEQPSAKKAL